MEHRHALARGRPANVVQPRHLKPQHLAIQKEQGAQGLLVRGGGHAALAGKVGQKRLKFCGAQLARMPQPVKAHVMAHPMPGGT